MNDHVHRGDVEDVLASIRRLVAAPRQASSTLVLSESQRIEGEVVPMETEGEVATRITGPYFALPPQIDPVPDTADPAPVPRRLTLLASGVFAEAGLPEDAEPIDEHRLRALIGEVVGTEMAGALGERLTRMVRKLVRSEINRALAEMPRP